MISRVTGDPGGRKTGGCLSVGLKFPASLLFGFELKEDYCKEGAW